MPTPKMVAIDKGSDTKRESDLSGHILGEDLSDIYENAGILNRIKKWPKFRRKDRQLVAAYTYIEGWSMFSKNDFQTK